MQSLDEFRPSTVCRKHFDREYQGVTLGVAHVAPVVAAEEALINVCRTPGLDAFNAREGMKSALVRAMAEAGLRFPYRVQAREQNGQVMLHDEPFLTARPLSKDEIGAWVQGLASYCVQQAREERITGLASGRARSNASQQLPPAVTRLRG